MSSEAMAIPVAGGRSRLWTQAVHEWVITVDHKRLGILYILLALFFLVIGGLEAAIIRIQLHSPPQRFRVAASLQSHVHHARHHHDFFRGDADSVWLRQLSRAADDRRARHGISYGLTLSASG